MLPLSACGAAQICGDRLGSVYMCVFVIAGCGDYCVCVVARESASFLIYGLHMVGGGSW